MPRDLIDWKNTYPAERVALGLLGAQGYRCHRAIDFCLGEMRSIRSRNGNPPSRAAIASRMDHGPRYGDEMRAVLLRYPERYLRGQQFAAEIALDMTDYGILAKTTGVASPAPSASLSTKINKVRKINAELEKIVCRPRGQKRVVNI